jgi:hypothetical protein
MGSDADTHITPERNSWVTGRAFVGFWEGADLEGAAGVGSSEGNPGRPILPGPGNTGCAAFVTSLKPAAYTAAAQRGFR